MYLNLVSFLIHTQVKNLVTNINEAYNKFSLVIYKYLLYSLMNIEIFNCTRYTFWIIKSKNKYTITMLVHEL